MGRISRKILRSNRGTSIVEYCVLLVMISVSIPVSISLSTVGQATSKDFRKLSEAMCGGGSDCTHGIRDVDVDKTVPGQILEALI